MSQFYLLILSYATYVQGFSFHNTAPHTAKSDTALLYKGTGKSNQL
jgi:hypothetical protein